ncbi:MAG: phosphoenolpyruvate-protein phosphotransferase [Gammaproteobacteria bacterium]|nr:phosphoenolpyruvate-protein phosphotransferase [Gammaproteobacteria bacterium]
MLNTNISGMPYFPGMAAGKLHRGVEGDIAKRIVLITPDEFTSFATLPAGFIVVEAELFSHSMIALLGLGLPTVLISAQQATTLQEGVSLLIDGSSGRITDNLEAAQSVVEPLPGLKAGQAVLMADGEPVNLCASVRHASAARQAVELGAKAIGLVRSEFLLPADDRVPNSTFYQRAFRELCEAASPLTVTFRLLDVAADKIPGWLPQSDVLGQALGLQGVRLFNTEPVQSVIDAQLAALSEMSNDFSLRLLIPFLVRLEEYEYWLAWVRQRLPEHVPIGAMAETPASVMDINHLLETADFVAIGCNDLMQSFYAADRDQPELRHYLDPYAPVLYRLFRQVAENSAKHLVDIQLCGLLPQLQGVLPVLLGLGYRTFSVDAPFIPYLAKSVASTTRAECEALAAQVCAVKTTQEVLEILQLPADRHPPFLI